MAQAGASPSRASHGAARPGGRPATAPGSSPGSVSPLLLSAAVFLCGFAVIGFSLPSLGENLRALAGVVATGWARPSAPLLLAVFLHQAGALTVFAGLTLALYGSGLGALPWFGAFAASSEYLLGCGLGALLLLGLALVKLWFAPVMVVALVLPAAAGLWRGRVNRPWAWPARDTVRGALLPVLLVFPWLLIPELQPDAWEYYLAGPERWIRLHGFSVRGATPPLHYPFVAEMLYSVPILFGCDQVVKWLNGAALAAGVVAAAAALEVPTGRALLVTLTSATSLYALTCGKNEGFSAGFILLAFSCGLNAVRRREAAGRRLSAVFAGLAFSTKYLAGLNVAWVPLFLWWESRSTAAAPRADAAREFRSWFGWGLIALGVAAPWLLKSWLLTGDPAYPVLSGFWPSLISGWDARHGQVWRLCSFKEMPPSTLAGRLGQGILGEHAVLAMALPFLVLVSGFTRRLAVSAVATYAVWCGLYWTPQTLRYAYGAVGVLLVAAAGTWGRWLEAGGLQRAAAVAVLGVGAAGSVSRLTAYPNPLPYMLGAESRADYVGRTFSTFGRIQERLHDGGRGRGLAALGRPERSSGLLLVGEVREYGMPRPCMLAQAHASGEAPLIWRLVNESANARELEIKFHQLHVDRLLYNFVTVRIVQQAFAPFRWTPRMIALYESFCARHLLLTDRSEAIDFANGGFCLFRLDARRDIGNASSTFFLPGAELDLIEALPLRQTGRTAESLAVLSGLVKAYPRVGSFRAELGYGLYQSGDLAGTYANLKPSVAAGMRTSLNYPTFGMAACRLGRLDEAEPVLRESLDGYPQHRAALQAGLDYIRAERAAAAMAGWGGPSGRRTP